MARDLHHVEGPIWISSPDDGMPTGRKGKARWMEGTATLRRAMELHTKHPMLEWKACGKKTENEDPGPTHKSEISLKLVIGKVHKEIHVAQEEGTRTLGWWPRRASSLAASSTTRPRTYFAVEAYEAQTLKSALRYNLAPSPPKTFLLGFASENEARAWQEASSTANNTWSRGPQGTQGRKGQSSSEVKKDHPMAGEEPKKKQAQGTGRKACGPLPGQEPTPSNLPTSSRTLSTAPSSMPPMHHLPCPGNRYCHDTKGLLLPPSPSSSSTLAGLQKRLTALHEADHSRRLAALKGIARLTDEASLRARYEALKNGGSERGREGKVPGGGARPDVVSERESTTAACIVNEEEQINELLARMTQEVRLQGSDGRGKGEEEGEEEGGIDGAALASWAEEGEAGGQRRADAWETMKKKNSCGTVDCADCVERPSWQSKPLGEVIASLQEEAQTLRGERRDAVARTAVDPTTPVANEEGEAADRGVSNSGLRTGGSIHIEGEEDEGPQLLGECAALLKDVVQGFEGEDAVAETITLHDLVEVKGKGELGEEGDDSQVAAVMELAHLWAKEGCDGHT